MGQRIMLGEDMEWDGGRWHRPDPMPQLVQQALSMQREAGMDNWAWRDAVESRLVSLGAEAAPYLESELASHDGYEADAIQVALFRLANLPLVPRESLQDWGQKHFGLSPGSPESGALKIFRVMDGHDGAGLAEFFPHHLFYVLQYRQTRLVVALAADAKVQPLEDDAAVARFIRMEGRPQFSVNDKTRLASAAALLMLARNVTPYRPDFRQTIDTDLHTFRYALQFEGFRQTASLTFGPDGMLATLASGQQKEEAKPAAPISAPTTTAAPPIMPE
jgi:hypothetical protein